MLFSSFLLCLFICVFIVRLFIYFGSVYLSFVGWLTNFHWLNYSFILFIWLWNKYEKLLFSLRLYSHGPIVILNQTEIIVVVNVEFIPL